MDKKMSFGIRVLEQGGGFKCEVVLGGDREISPLITTFWTRFRYEAQWLEALQAFVSGAVTRCALITDIQDPNVSYGLCYWALFKEGGVVYVQERFSREDVDFLVRGACVAEPYIPPRAQWEGEEQAAVSEWVVEFEDVCRFVDGLTRSG